MRVRCTSCGAEYETPATRTALILVDRCERCGRPGLRVVDARDDRRHAPGAGPAPPGRADRRG
jgi:hypothetical protein